MRQIFQALSKLADVQAIHPLRYCRDELAALVEIARVQASHRASRVWIDVPPGCTVRIID